MYKHIVYVLLVLGLVLPSCVPDKIAEPITIQQEIEYSLKGDRYEVSTYIWFEYDSDSSIRHKDIVASQFEFIPNDLPEVDKEMAIQMKWALAHKLTLLERLDEVHPLAEIAG